MESTGLLAGNAIPKHSNGHRAWRAFAHNTMAPIGLAIVLVLALVAIFADDGALAWLQGRDALPLIAPSDPFEQNATMVLHGPDSVHLLGSDGYGRDVLSRVVHAGRVSLVIGLGATLLGAMLGTIVGLTAAYSGGWIEDVLMRIVDVLMSFPGLLMGMMILAVLDRLPGSGITKSIIGIGLISTSSFARVVHGSTLSAKELLFITAARAAGARDFYIMVRHILPNILGEITVLASLQIAQAIRTEASLSFIGLGVPLPTPTWGNMIREGITSLSYAPWMAIYPSLAILLAVMGFNLLGDGLRDAVDPRMR